ncbi:MAG TPA: PHP domain-containing protein [Acidimicrobiia bacterium]|nr:PHP domain-containing protein [Acidimicrobiia bacterium]
MAIDLHLHSNRSDGTDPPERIVELAVAARLDAIALTDHDTLEGIEEARAAAAGRIRLVPGVELSVEWPTGAMHLLGYWTEPGTGPVEERLAELRQDRNRRNAEILGALRGLGIDITVDEIVAEAGGSSVGRPHIAAVLLRKGEVASIAEAFDRYLARGRPAYRPRLRLEAAVATGLIHEAGGVASVAHPHTVATSAAEFGRAFEAFADAGIDGVECHYAEYAPDQRQHLATMAERLGLVPTGGSDYHGDNKPGLAVGSGHGDLRVPDDVLDRLEQRRR